MAVAGFLKWGVTLEALIAIMSLLAFLGIALVDLDTYIIPDSLCVIVALLGMGFAVATGQAGDLVNRIFAGLLGAGAIVLVILASRGGMGFGDAKLAASMGIVLGLQGLGVALFMGFVVGALTALLLLITKRKRRGDAIPFGPFLSAGAIIALLQGHELCHAYVRWSGL
jgi:leader peptidase (prepilin peptidase)/N-methyltransferase